MHAQDENIKGCREWEWTNCKQASGNEYVQQDMFTVSNYWMPLDAPNTSLGIPKFYTG
jgi:hypothetical protein